MRINRIQISKIILMRSGKSIMNIISESVKKDDPFMSKLVDRKKQTSENI
jgi:hypothetical protein